MYCITCFLSCFHYQFELVSLPAIAPDRYLYVLGVGLSGHVICQVARPRHSYSLQLVHHNDLFAVIIKDHEDQESKDNNNNNNNLQQCVCVCVLT